MPKLPTLKPVNWSDPENIKSFSWCLNHGITISMFATSPGFGNRHWVIEVNVNGKKVKSPREYGPDELYSKVFELYKFYYNKYNERIQDSK